MDWDHPSVLINRAETCNRLADQSNDPVESSKLGQLATPKREASRVRLPSQIKMSRPHRSAPWRSCANLNRLEKPWSVERLSCLLIQPLDFASPGLGLCQWRVKKTLGQSRILDGVFP
jgi:hypothetical protein